MTVTTIPTKRWNILPSPPDCSLGRADIPPIISHILYHRGITTPSALDAFLDPSRIYPLDPFLLPGIGPSVERLIKASRTGETVGIFGDFDVDGVTGTAIVAQGLEGLGVKVLPYIPHRVNEGHGLNTDAVHIMKEMGVSVLITVDCGVTSVNEVALAQDLDIDVIVTDHHIHQSSSPLPPALAIIDPKLESSDYPFPDLSGGGLALKLIQGLYHEMGKQWGPELLELAALSTVADLVPLYGENRYLVQKGLDGLKTTERLGLRALYQRARIKADSISAETVAFTIAPRLNAAGRLDHASASFRLLTTTSAEEASSLASHLEGLNRVRQKQTAEAWSRAQEHVSAWNSLPPLIMVNDDEVSPGIAGLVASRLVDRFHRPSAVVLRAGGVFRASARSIPGFNMADALANCGELLVRHGGHSMAAGFEVTPNNLAAFETALQNTAQEMLNEHDLQPTLDIDAEMPILEMVGEPYRWLSALEPFGTGNKMPVFLARNLHPAQVRTTGDRDQHLRLKLKENRVVWEGMAFDQADKWVSGTESVDVVYTLGTEQRGDTSIMALKILDFRPSVLHVMPNPKLGLGS